jgi:cation-transporting ATPase 13A2
MSVIARTLGDKQFQVFVKGAPEKIVELCRKDSIPKNFHSLLSTYTLRGFRVIGLARRVLAPEINWVRAHKMKRDQVSCLHFVIYINSLGGL